MLIRGVRSWYSFGTRCRNAAWTCRRTSAQNSDQRHRSVPGECAVSCDPQNARWPGFTPKHLPLDHSQHPQRSNVGVLGVLGGPDQTPRPPRFLLRANKCQQSRAVATTANRVAAMEWRIRLGGVGEGRGHNSLDARHSHNATHDASGIRQPGHGIHIAMLNACPWPNSSVIK